MSSFVVATAGHVDHGKSSLVRAVTGTDPDRLSEEKRRGLTVDLGFAWTRMPSGREVSFVDVPGHERFLGNMLAGIGPAPLVCFVVAADEGWSAQSSDHRDAVAALGIHRGIIVVTRADLAPGSVSDCVAEARTELAGTGLAGAPAVSVSSRTGEGIDDFRRALDSLLATEPPPDATAPVRMWLDRSFAITGAGTIVTGTVSAGRLRRGDTLDLVGRSYEGPVEIRGLQTHNTEAESIGPSSRAAVNLRGISVEQAARGDVLISPGAWWTASVVDIRRCTGTALTDVPAAVSVHIGTASLQARLRPFDADHARMTFPRSLPVRIGDRIVLQSGSGREFLGGSIVLDVDPPALTRRGDGARRAKAVAEMDAAGDVAGEVLRRGPVEEERLRRFGVAIPHSLPAGVERIGRWLVGDAVAEGWKTALRSAVEREFLSDPLSAGLTRPALAHRLELPDESLLDGLIAAAGLRQAAGRVRLAGEDGGLGPIEDAVGELERRLAASAFNAPDAFELEELGLGRRELAAAEERGRLVRLDDKIVLLPSAPAQAVRLLAELDQPFTVATARRALETTRRTALPLLEYLDAKGWTRRIDVNHREVVFPR